MIKEAAPLNHAEGLASNWQAPDVVAQNFQDRRNGHGYSMSIPSEAGSITGFLESLPAGSNFIEMATLAGHLATHRCVAVSGAPGSGKSHLVADLEEASRRSRVPFFELSLHINAGKREGPDNIRAPLDAFRQAAQKAGGLVILDNLDYLGYHGDRKRGRSADYARDMNAIVQELLADPALIVVATMHDTLWRKGQWRWGDQTIDGPATAAIEAFPAQMEFEGRISLNAVVHILQSRRADHSLPAAHQLALELQRRGRADFFHAHLVDPNARPQDLSGIFSALARGRADRSGQKPAEF